MLIKAAINGGRSKAEHPAVPVTPEEQAAAVLECLNAGATAIHLHVRGSSGAESLHPDDVAKTMRSVRAAAPKSPIGISTGEWIIPDVAERFAAVNAWSELPDFVSVNLNETGAGALAQLLFTRGVGIEAGLSDAGCAEVLLGSELTSNCLRVLLEPQEQEFEKALETVQKMEQVLAKGGVLLPTVLHGTGATSWQILEAALQRGYGIRIGFEDTLHLADGMVARSNAELVAAAVKLSERV